jgi:hypothetical protein
MLIMQLEYAKKHAHTTVHTNHTLITLQFVVFEDAPISHNFTLMILIKNVSTYVQTIQTHVHLVIIHHVSVNQYVIKLLCILLIELLEFV